MPQAVVGSARLNLQSHPAKARGQAPKEFMNTTMPNPGEHPGALTAPTDSLRSAHSNSLDPWLTALDGAPAVLALPTDTTLRASGRVGVDVVAIDATNIRELLAKFVQATNAPGEIVIAAVWAALLHRYSGESDLLLGRRSTVKPSECDVLRVSVTSDQTLLTLVEAVTQVDADAAARGELRLDAFLEAMKAKPGPDRHPIFQAGIEQISSTDDGPWIDASVPCDLVLRIAEVNGGHVPDSLAVRSDRFSIGQATRIANHVAELLRQALNAPDAPLASLSFLAPSERDELATWNATTVTREPDITIAGLFEAQVERTPKASALEFGDESLTFEELNRQSSTLAVELKSLGVGPDVRVGVSIERSFAMIVAVLAVLKAGGAYVPVDPDYPQARREFMLEDANVALLLTGGGAAERFGVEIENRGSANADVSAVSADPGEHLTYVIYTSGSTGRPKGVALPQRALSNLLLWQHARDRFVPGARTLQFTSLSFDVSFQEILSTLCTGGTLVMVTDAVRRDPMSLLETLIDKKVGRLFVPFVALRGIANAAVTTGRFPDDLGEVYTAGEQLSVDDTIRSFFSAIPNCLLENQYGPSESHVVSAHTMSGEPTTWEALPPIGTPIANTQLFIVDSSLSETPVAVAGELLIGGTCLAHGYLGNAELTAEKFVVLTIGGHSPQRVYRSGDLALRRGDGSIEFHGRRDNQVKFRGFRIEPGEVSASLSNHPDVEQCVATVRQVEGVGARLVAFLCSPTQNVSLESVHRYAQANLPDYLVPSHYSVLAKFPLTASGKIDVDAIPTPTFNREILGSTYKAPKGSEEIRLARIWGSLLGITDIGSDDDFFVLGGDSLMAVEMFAKIRAEFDRDLPLGSLAASPTIAGLATALRGSTDDWAILVPMRTTGAKTPLFCVHGGTGNVATFPRLVRALPDDQPFYALQWDGLNGTRGTRGIAAMADRYLTEVRAVQPHGPYLFAGQCVGGLIALEMARTLLSVGERVELVVLYDSPNIASPNYTPESKLVPLGTVVRYPQPRRRVGIARTKRTMDVESRKGGVRPEWRTEYSGQVMVDSTMSHQPVAVEVPTVYVSSGENDAYAISLSGRWRDGVMGWSSSESPLFEIHQVAGGHNELLYSDEAVALLADSLDKAHGRIDGTAAIATEEIGPGSSTGVNAPMFSILIAPFCRPREVREAIDSVLAQTCGDFEIIVSDNWSADDTPDVVKSYDDPRITLTRPEKHGFAADAFEHARTVATGRYIIALKATDGLTPDALERFRAVIDQQSPKVLFCTFSDYYDDRHESKAPTAPKPGTLLIGGGSDRTYTFPSRAYLAPLFALRPYFHHQLSCYVIDRELAAAVGRSYGTVFQGFETDFFTLPVVIDAAETIVFVDRPLVVLRHTANPPFEESTDGLSPEGVWRVHHGWEHDLTTVPVKSHAEATVLVEGLWSAQNNHAGSSLLRYGRDSEAFAELLRKELTFRRHVGIDVEADFQTLNAWVRRLPTAPDPLVKRNRREATVWRQVSQLRRARGYRRATKVDAGAQGVRNLVDAARMVSATLRTDT